MGNRKKMIETFEKFTEIASYMEAIQKDFPEDIYYLGILEDKFLTFQKPELSIEENLQLLIKAAVELTTQEAPKWEMIAARLLLFTFERELRKAEESCQITTLYEKIVYLTGRGLYGQYILENYTKEEIDEFGIGIAAQPLCDPHRTRCGAGKPTGDVSWNCHAFGDERAERQGALGKTLLRYAQ